MRHCKLALILSKQILDILRNGNACRHLLRSGRDNRLRSLRISTELDKRLPQFFEVILNVLRIFRSDSVTSRRDATHLGILTDSESKPLVCLFKVGDFTAFIDKSLKILAILLDNSVFRLLVFLGSLASTLQSTKELVKVLLLL